MSAGGHRRVLHAAGVSRRALRVLACPGVGRVHSVFRRCINVTRGHGEWLTLGVEPFPRMPDGIVIERLEAESFQALEVFQGAGVRISDGGLSIPEADIAIATEGARIFDTKRARFDLEGRASLLGCNLETARRTIIDRGSDEGLGRMRGALLAGDAGNEAGAGTLAEALCRRGSEAIEGLLEGLRWNDWEAMRRGAAALMGLGVGMTPSGDDILSGLAASLYAIGGYESFFDVLRELLTEGTRTTDLCELGYRRIAEGEIADVLYEPMRALVEDDEKAVREAVAALLRQGSSSGTELAIGVCLGMALAGTRQEHGAERSEFSLC